MARKRKTFADKVEKALKKKGNQCLECGSVISRVMYVRSEFSERTNSWRFSQSFVNVCKCNSKEIYG